MVADALFPKSWKVKRSKKKNLLKRILRVQKWMIGIVINIALLVWDSACVESSQLINESSQEHLDFLAKEYYWKFSSTRMESKSPDVGGVSRVLTDKMVSFFLQSDVKNRSDMCDERFLVKRETETTCYQLNMDITCLYLKSSTEMIADTGWC